MGKSVTTKDIILPRDRVTQNLVDRKDVEVKEAESKSESKPKTFKKEEK